LGDLRKDYVLEKFVVVSSSDKVQLPPLAENKCPYCPGNESMTEPAVLALVVKDGLLQRLSDSEDSVVEDWSVRVFQSPDPLVATGSASSFGEKPLYSEPAYGYHQILVASPEHDQSLTQMSVEQWANVLVVVQDRVRYLYTQKSVTYVTVYINSGNSVGDNVLHPHLNIVTFATIPPTIEAEAEGYHKYMNENGNCPACNMIGVESSGPRQVLATDSFLCFCPWAPTYQYEFWIYPKRHLTSFSKITQKEINDLALILRATLGGMAKALKDAPFNLVFHLSPEKKNSRQIHWHIEVYPQLANWSGLERGFGVFISSVRPEKSAEILGSAARKELANLVGIV
jgi:UDPglucose--hexose-1-phosphate uridylyltransferase